MGIAMPKNCAIEDRFFSKFVVDPVSKCWNWTGRLNTSGYGMIAGTIHGKRYRPVGYELLAHRASWIIHNGEIPAGDGYHGTVVMHKCDNPLCVNPNHLKLGSNTDNMRDMCKKGRHKVAKGLDNPGAKILSKEVIEYIRSTKPGTRGLGKMFGVSKGTISNIRKGLRYANV